MRSVPLILCTVLAVPLAAQTTMILPSPQPLAANTSLPFSAGVGRYQQWFAASQTTQLAAEPIRIDQIEVLAGSATAITTTLDLQVAMAHASPSGLFATFDLNYVTPPVTVMPRRTLTITPAPPGATVLTLPLSTPFTWDGVSPFLVEVRIFGNGQSGQPFNFDLRGTSQGLGMISRVYQNGNASATSGVQSAGQGLMLRFRTRVGAQTHYGIGCRGVNFIVPTASTLSLPTPGFNWVHQLDNAAGQHACLLVFGFSRTQWVTPDATIPLPADLGPLIGGTGCQLFAAPDMFLIGFTNGGAGNASASLSIAVPPIPTIVDLSVFSQWVVEDPGSINSVISVTDALWSIVTPVGG
jgi:hypothetical protein